VLIVAGCGGGGDISRDTFSSDLRERTTVPEDVASCLTERIYDQFDQGEVNEIYRAASEDELEDDTRETLSDINEACFTEASDEAADAAE
jgi:hypothetical protein